MSQDDISTKDIFNIPSYIDYKIETEKLETRGYQRHTPRNIGDSVEDLVNQGFQVTRIESFDNDTLLPIVGRVDIYTMILQK